VEAPEREALFHQYLPLVYGLVRLSLPKDAPIDVRDDVTQEGLQGLWKAILHFETSKLPPSHLGVYARFWIRGHILRELKRTFRRQRRESTGSFQLPEFRAEPADSLGDSLSQIVASLPQPEQDLLISWYGLGEEKPQSVATLAARFDLTPSKVRTRIERAARMVVERMETRR
jgi:RNA polymerase sigma factor (sigma-70 family)